MHDEDRSRRLESDSAAVQVLTIHRCKGLEFPIVYCPFLWQPPYMPDEQLPVFHDAAAGDRRTIDVGGPSHAGFADHQARHVAEVQGEALRLAYVALTRARHQTVLHWASTFDSRESSLARLLFAAGLGAGRRPSSPRAPQESDGHRPPRGDRRAAPPARSASNERRALAVRRWKPPVTDIRATRRAPVRSRLRPRRGVAPPTAG